MTWWRHLALAGVVGGLLASPWLATPAGWPLPIAVLAVLGVAGRLARWSPPQPWLWLPLLIAALALSGLGLGNLRLEALAHRAATPAGAIGSEVVATGFVANQPRHSFGELRFPLDTDRGRLLVVAGSQSSPELGIGDSIEVRGRLSEPEEWRAAERRRLGVAVELHASQIRALPGGRSGLDGLLDRARGRAERAVAAGLGPGQEALARGFVLGQDDRIDEGTREQFRRSGLAHLLSCYQMDRTSNYKRRISTMASPSFSSSRSGSWQPWSATTSAAPRPWGAARWSPARWPSCWRSPGSPLAARSS